MEFRDLRRQYNQIRDEIEKGIAEVISSAQFISGPQVKELERQLASYVGVKHCITCANGTDAITIALKAYGVGQGDAVFVPDFTFFSSGESPAMTGATPIFVDVDDSTYNIDRQSLEEAVIRVTKEGVYRPRAVIAVDLFGRPADYDAVRSVCEKYDLLLLEDGAQGFGGKYKGKRACSLGDIATTSFFPAKPLGCYGDGGAVFTNDDEIAILCRSIAVHGKDMEHPDDPNTKYNNIRLGYNSRLDTMQAAILLPKLTVFQEFELDAVNHVANMYGELLKNVEGLILPETSGAYDSSWAQYTVQLREGLDRGAIQTYLKNAGIPTMVYYIRPMHLQGAFAGSRSSVADCPVTEYLCRHVLCLPIHPYLRDEEVIRVCDHLKKAIDGLAF